MLLYFYVTTVIVRVIFSSVLSLDDGIECVVWSYDRSELFDNQDFTCVMWMRNKSTVYLNFTYLISR